LANPTAEAFAERLKMLTAQDFGAEYRPGLTAALANGSATPDQMLRISSYIAALDKFKVASANATAGFKVVHSPYESDLLSQVGQPQAIVQRANSTVQDTADQARGDAFLRAAGNQVTQFLSNSGEFVFPSPASFADPSKAPNGQQRHEGWLMTALDTLGNLPGFIYRYVKTGAEHAALSEASMLGADDKTIDAAKKNLGLDQHEAAMKGMNYDPNSFTSDVAFLWSHGEADFANLDDLRNHYGNDMVNTALGVFYNKSGYGGDEQSALGSYVGNLDAAVRDGKLSPEAYADEVQRLSSDDFRRVYEAVDMQHVSFGRDLARLILPESQTTDPDNSGLFHWVSGTGDFLWTLGADPTLLAGKAVKTIRMARYGADALQNWDKVSRLYGVVNKTTGEVQKTLTYTAWRARQNVTDWLARNAEIRAAAEAGEHERAAALLAANDARHPDLRAAYREAQGWRVAITPEEQAAAREAGSVLTLGGDVVHEATAFTTLKDGRTIVDPASEWLMVKAKPIENLDEWVDWLTTQGGLYRMWSGAAANQLGILPGRLGFAAEARAALVAKRAFTRTTNGLAHSPLGSLLAAGGEHVLDYLKDPDKIIASDAGEGFKNAFKARGSAQADLILGQGADSYWLRQARRLKAEAESKTRRLSSLVPTNSMIAFSSAQAGKDIERFARLALPKYEASLIRYMWEHAPSEAARRQVGKAMINEFWEASGLSRTAYGRDFLNKFNDGWDNWEKRRYGIGDTDVIPDALNGGEKRAALHLSQLETALVLPAWPDVRVAAAKAAILGFDKQLGDITAHGFTDWFTNAAGDKDVMGGLRRMLASPSLTLRYGLFNSVPMQKVFSLMKIGWLLTSANGLRQLAEEYVGIKTNRETNAAFKVGKQAIRLNKGADAVPGIGTPSKLNVVAAVHHLIPHDLRAAVANDDDVHAAIAAGRFRIGFGDAPLNPAQQRAVQMVGQRIITPEVDEILGGRYAAEAEGGVEDAVRSHGANVQTTRNMWKKPERIVGYKQTSLDGDAGRKALARMLVERFYDYDEPSRRALAYLMWSKAAKDKAFLSKLDEDTLARMEDLYPNGYVPGKRVTVPTTAHLKDYVANDERMARFRQRAEHLNLDERGRAIDPKDGKAKAAAVERYVRNLIADTAGTVYNRAGETMNPDLVSLLLHPNRIPSEAELAAYDLADLPAHVVRAEYMPVEIGRLSQGLNGLGNLASRAYDFVVTNPMRRLERKPLFIGQYVKAFERMQPYEEHLVVNLGVRPEEAERILDNLAYQHALHDTLRHIDNPKVASQFAVVAKNTWLFYRAQEDWARRWSRLLRESPEAIRLAHMSLMSTQQAGMVDKDSDGNLIYQYPGSGALIEAFIAAASALGFGSDGVQIPYVHDLTSQVNYLNPSILNPIGFSATPMLSIPFRMLAAVIPGGDMLKSQADLAMNGQLGQGRSWWEQFMPTQVHRIMQLFSDPNDTATTVGGAAATALANAVIAGQGPQDGDDVAAQHFVTNVQTQTIGALFMRSLLSFALPGAPSMPELDYRNDKGELSDGDADFAWRIRGIETLSQEYKAMIQSLGYEKAVVVWGILHPDKLPFEVGRTTAQAKGVDIPPTLGSTQWVFDHKDLFEGPYSRVAAYFIPSAPGEFDQTGWNAMTEIGIRQYKDISQFYMDVVTKNATTAYFKKKDAYDAARATARNDWERKALDNQWAQDKQDLYARYPILPSYFANSQARADDRRQMLGELTQMVEDPNVQGIPDLSGVAKMLIVYNNYQTMMDQYKNQRSNSATATKQDIQNSYSDTMQSIISDYPGLSDLYTGVFRYLE
jgi:hypothetical protein